MARRSVQRSIAALAVLVAGAALAPPTVAETAGQRTYFAVRLTGSIGPLSLGMTRQAALRFLNFPTYRFNRGGVSCAQYDMGLGARRGPVGACFDRRGRLIAFGGGGDLICFRSRACFNGRDVIPQSVRSRFRTAFDASSGIYTAYLRMRFLGRAYEVVMERAAYDRAGTGRAIGFAPCGANAAVKYWVRVDC
jgi:hypothetical protein